MLLIHYNLYTIICNIILTLYVRHQPRKNTIKLWENSRKTFIQQGFLFSTQFNLFVSNVSFLYLLKISEKR